MMKYKGFLTNFKYCIRFIYLSYNKFYLLYELGMFKYTKIKMTGFPGQILHIKRLHVTRVSTTITNKVSAT